MPAATGNLLSDQSIVPSSASVPTNGMYLPAANTLGFATNSTNAILIDASQNVGLKGVLDVPTNTTAGYALRIIADAANTYAGIQFTNNPVTAALGYYRMPASSVHAWYDSGATERMRIDSSGNLLVGTTAPVSTTSRIWNAWDSSTQQGMVFRTSSATFNGSPVLFYNSSGTVSGSIAQTASTIAYNTSSDYRLKDNVQPMVTGLATVSALKPVTYDWEIDGSQGEGFIAHELQEIIPLAVSGEKDAVNEDGSIKPQGVDYSKIVVHLVAAIQELSAKNDALETRLSALEAK